MSKASGEADGSNFCNVDAEMQPMTSDADDVHAAPSETQAGHKRRRAVRITVALISLEALCWLFGGEKLYHELQAALELHPRSRPHAQSSAKRGTPKRRPKQGGSRKKSDAAQPYAIDKSTKREYQKWHARVRRMSQMGLQPSDWTPDVNWADHPTKRADRFPSVQERVEYYMGRWHDVSTPLYGPDFDKNTYIQRKTTREYGPFSDILVNLYGMDRDRLWQCYQNKEELKVFSPYCRDYIDVAILHSKGSANVLHYIGDGLPFVPEELRGYPIYAKVRPFCDDARGRLGDNGVRLENGMCGSKKKVEPIVLPLNRKRHYAAAAAVPQNDVPWEEKLPLAVWRGQYGKIHDAISDTNDVKHALVSRHLNSTLVDAKFSKHTKDAPPEMVGDYLNVASQLRCKYVISIEGNDVSSGLKWMLLSNSVVLMPPITWESWAMEGLLKPFVHYLPLRADMSNVEDMVQWAEAHPAEARRIAERSTLFIYDLLFHPDASKDEQQIMIQMMERFERNFGSKERREAAERRTAFQLPSVKERVKHAMGRWYHNTNDLSMKRSSENDLPRSISRSTTKDGLFIASGSHIASCAMPNSTHPRDIRALCQSSLPEFDERHTADLKSSSFNRLRKTKKGERMRLATVSSWRHDGKGTKESKRVLLDDTVKVICFGDCSRDGAGIPYFAGSRKNGADGDGILWPFGLDEAVSAAKSDWFEAADDRFEKKTPTAVWSGIDTKEVADEDSERKDRISQMLAHRYLVAVEHEDGINNDLLWMLLSRSVVLMPTERRTTTWLLEESLQPYVHYVPVASDYSDVNAKVRWCEDNPDEARLISQRATLFAQKLLLDTEEVKLRVMERYTALFGEAGGGLE